MATFSGEDNEKIRKVYRKNNGIIVIVLNYATNHCTQNGSLHCMNMLLDRRIVYLLKQKQMIINGFESDGIIEAIKCAQEVIIKVENPLKN